MAMRAAAVKRIAKIPGSSLQNLAYAVTRLQQS
jgi:hypothetical protein